MGTQTMIAPESLNAVRLAAAIVVVENVRLICLKESCVREPALLQLAMVDQDGDQSFATCSTVVKMPIARPIKNVVQTHVDPRSVAMYEVIRQLIGATTKDVPVRNCVNY